MRIKSITKTSSFKSIRFSEIIPNDLVVGVPTKPTLDYKVYTPNGWQPILGFYKTEPMKTIKLECGNGNIECAEDHLVVTTNGQKRAIDCDGDSVITIDGPQKCTAILTNETKNLYDIQIPTPHIWYTSNIQSHNSLLMVNSSIANVKRGLKVLHVTLEMSAHKTALRYAGAFTNVEVHKRFEQDKRKLMEDTLSKIRASFGGDLVIYEFPPDEISVDHIYQLCDQLRRSKNWRPDVIVIDYLELMNARKAHDNKNEYDRQKKVATQIRGLAKNENVFIITATQTNRETDSKKTPQKQIGPQVIDVNRIAESYGKAMPMDYLISINQSQEEYGSKTPMLRFYIAKNRNGPKNKTVTALVNYQTFRVVEHTPTRVTA